MEARKAIGEVGISFTYMSANCFGGYFIGNLCQLGALLPPKHTVRFYGNGNEWIMHRKSLLSNICLTNFDNGEGGEEASKLYPEVRYTRVDEYLRQYL
ncbi:hypothetical protein MLD38_037771 [Melastoma candidum]|uniref:Uncharacterized protein n=1 Tax=Melastoma candidum TaxID=119954 RepID=A0ACB9LP89_9MYRT|nr:hypothetical protein MLD38_037771 [Melastoma candidum]